MLFWIRLALWLAAVSATGWAIGRAAEWAWFSAPTLGGRALVVAGALVTVHAAGFVVAKFLWPPLPE